MPATRNRQPLTAPAFVGLLVAALVAALTVLSGSVAEARPRHQGPSSAR
jgi:hypothetical protein